MPKASSSPVKDKKCGICRARFRSQGYPAHVKKCQIDREMRRAERRYAKDLEKRLRGLDTLAPRVAILDEPLNPPDAFAATEPMDLDMGSGTSFDVIRSVSDSEPSPPSVAQTAGPSGGPEAHESMIIYHPNSGRATEAQLLDGPSRKTNPPRNLEPWSPFFKSREDFEISEVIMKVGMSKSDCDRVFKAIRRCLDGKGSFNLKKYSDARSAWNAYRLS